MKAFRQNSFVLNIGYFPYKITIRMLLERIVSNIRIVIAKNSFPSLIDSYIISNLS